MLKTAIWELSGRLLLHSNDAGYRLLTKLLIVMKLTIILLTTVMTCAYATGHSQGVTFSGTNVHLKEVFTVIEKQTGYVVLSNRSTWDKSQPVTVSVNNMPLNRFLQEILSNQPLEFFIEGKTIVLSSKTIHYEPVPNLAPPGRDIPGYVFDQKNNAPIPGVSISINGTNKATQSDERGGFILKGIDGEITITLTCIGYEKRVLKILNSTPNILAALKPATNDLDQAVVQGYGITSKRLSTGNITKVTGEEIRRQPVMNPMAALQGRVPGLLVTPLSGNASSPIKLEIRGRNSINPNMITEPLYVIDGIPQTVLESGLSTNNSGVSSGFAQGVFSYTKGQSPFFNINPKDIESIEVLKDADATAIYGSRAANGVIMITTKKGQPGPTSFEVSVQQGVLTVPHYPEMMNLRQYLDMRYEAFKNDGYTPTPDNAPDLTVWDTTRSTNWIRELLGTGKNTDVSATLSGGDIRTNFRLGAGYTDQVDLNSRSGGNRRGTLQLNLRHASLDQKLTINLTAGYAVSKVDAILDPNSGFATPPNAPPIFNEAGDLNFAAYNNNASSFSDHFTFGYILKPNIVKTNVLNSTINIGYTLLKGLVFSGSLSYQSMNNTNDVFSPLASANPQMPVSSVFLQSTKNTNVAFEPQINYTRSISKGRLSVMVTGTTQTANTTTGNIAGYNFSSDDLINNISNAQFRDASNTSFDFKYAAISTRINYNWDQKYILNLQARRDGSSRFAPGQQFGNFGSVGASWIATEEEWLQKKLPSWVSFIKFRGSYGITGSDNIGNYEYLPRYSTRQPESFQNMYAYNNVQPYVSIIPINQDYRWEEQHTLEGGLNLGFLEDRISMELAVYRKRSGNQLTLIPTPNYTGFPNIRANWDAIVQNSGVEGSVQVNIIRKKDMQLAAYASISRNENKLASYPNIERSPYATTYRIGESLQTRYIMRLTGVDPLTGEYSFEDYNKDGAITTNLNVLPGTGNDDRYLAYDLNPKYYGGFGTDLTWKNLGLFLQFSYSNQIGNAAYAGISPGGMGNLVLPPDMISNHWRNPGDIAKYAKFSTYGDTRGLGFVNKSYVRLNSVQFSYSMPEQLFKKAGLRSCMFSLSVSNLFVITSYDMDPDIQGGSFNPTPRTIVGRLSFTL